jgi:HSP20 family protein
MSDKTKEEKGHEVQKTPPRGMTSPFERFDFLPDSGFFKEMDRFFDDYLPRRWRQHFHRGFLGGPVAASMSPFEGKTPRVDVINREEDILVRAELPGVDKKDVSVAIADNVLTIEASMGKEEKEEKAEYYRQEICRGSYRRTFELPAAVKEDEAKATFQNGLLELTLPKTEKTKRTTIKVD